MFKTTIRAIIRLAAVALLSGVAQVRADITALILPGSDYNSNTAAMNATLGITGDSIYNFGNTNLDSGLTSINLHNFPTGSDLTDTSLPQLYDPSKEIVNGQSTSSNLWAGTYAFNNTMGNTISNGLNDNYAQVTTFNFASGVTFVGIGLASFQSLSSSQFPVTDHSLLINGVVQPQTLESLGGMNWTPGIFGLNGYLEVTATAGSTIQSIGFENNTKPDFLVFSHLALSTVPEPSSFLLLVAGGLVIGVAAMRNLARKRLG